MNHITWQQYFMGIAMLSAQRSKDPSTKVGACIVNKDNKIVGIGYNGMPVGCDDSIMPWERKAKDNLQTKYPYVVHAELNAILNSNQQSLKGCTLYVTLFPCNECAKAVIQSGIRHIVYYDNKYPNAEFTKASELLLRTAGIIVEQYDKTKSDDAEDFNIVLKGL